VITFLVLAEGANLKRLEDLFDGSKYAPAPLSDIEKELIQKFAGQTLNHPDMPLAVRVECPPLYEESLRASFSADFEKEMQAMIAPAPLDMRVNVFLATREKVQDYLKAAG